MSLTRLIIFLVLIFLGIFGSITLVENILLSTIMSITQGIANCENVHKDWIDECQNYRENLSKAMFIVKIGLGIAIPVLIFKKYN